MADAVRQRVDAFVAARVAATSTTLPPTTVAPDDRRAVDRAVDRADDRTRGR